MQSSPDSRHFAPPKYMYSTQRPNDLPLFWETELRTHKKQTAKIMVLSTLNFLRGNENTDYSKLNGSKNSPILICS
jgi:hypothetical protein